MVRYVITVDVREDEVSVVVSRNGRYYDEVSFHITEVGGFSEYMDDITTQILREMYNLRKRG